ncbi:hypothetical protein XI00_25880 [Bradyrhizobium sp. CCBAU 21359]|nr:hypothetical protein [Bradyrhizobium sp. CCBAU 21360]MDA9457610.1 hypothetical protein [Bradyrhizobium sp. CCBAU 21359]
MRAIRGRVRGKVEFKTFTWSGRNSFRAREIAVRQFRRHLDQSMVANPECLHVVLAHSHGGTVAAKALAYMSNEFSGHCRVRALICMATPFAFLSKFGSHKHTTVFFGAVGSLITALLLLIFPEIWAIASDTHPFIPYVASFLLPVLIGGLFFNLHLRVQSPSDYLDFPKIYPSIAVYLIRGTRDEASLSIGFAQSLQALIDVLYRAFDGGPSGGVRFGLSYAVFLVPAVLLGAALYDDRPLSEAANFWIVYTLGFGIGAFVYLGAYALAAAAVGFTEMRYWPSVVEIGESPPKTPSFIKTYSDMDESDATLRHKIYAVPDVQDDIASIIQRIVHGIDQTIYDPEWKYPKWSDWPHWAYVPAVPEADPDELD